MNRCDIHTVTSPKRLALSTLEFKGTSFSWIRTCAHLASEALQAFLGIYFKVLSFLVKALFCMHVFMWHSTLSLRSDYFNWNWPRSIQSIPSGTEVFQQNFTIFQPSPCFFGIQAILWELTEEALVWLLWDQNVPFKMAHIKPASWVVWTV